MRKLTPAQIRALRALADHGRGEPGWPFSMRRGMVCRSVRTLAVLIDSDLVEQRYGRTAIIVRITAAGLAALAELDKEKADG